MRQHKKQGSDHVGQCQRPEPTLKKTPIQKELLEQASKKQFLDQGQESQAPNRYSEQRVREQPGQRPQGQQSVKPRILMPFARCYSLHG